MEEIKWTPGGLFRHPSWDDVETDVAQNDLVMHTTEFDGTNGILRQPKTIKLDLAAETPKSIDAYGALAGS
jgi:hypothetical protein